MKTKSKYIIYSLCAGIFIGIISIATNQVSINSATWAQTFILYSATAIGISLIIAFAKALPEPTKLKYIFNVKYFFYVSLLMLGAGVILTPFLFINGNNLPSSLFFLLFGVSILIGSLIAKKLFGEY